MGQYALHQIITREFREDSVLDADAVLSGMYLDQIRSAGYTPVGAPVLTWYEITQEEAEMDAAACGVVTCQAGDWRVRAVVEVAESEEVAP